MRLQVRHRVLPQFHLLLNHIVHSHALTIVWTRATQVQPEVHLLVQSQVHLFVHLYIDLEVHLHVQLHHQANIKHIYYISFALSCASPGALKISLLLWFLIGQILHPFAPLSPFLRAFSSTCYIPSHFQSQLYLRGLFMTFLRSFKKIIDCTLKSTIIYTNVYIIYGDGIALYACVK